ncbi:MAG: decarboxylating NADP(+)-dependent phosphogluconate dehydrogenase [Gammaproteobacteria bacterium]|nr:decarboxylating NADP(+)-dependent phosphogluconate dehydrogenase [Gammaproteobacteria bacterium]
MEKADIGLIGLAVMGQNLVLNMADKGIRVAVFNRTTEKVDEFLAGEAKTKSIIGTHSIEAFVESLSSPRKIMLMVKAGAVVDDFIDLLIPHLDDGDVIIDGGNSLYSDTERRTKSCKEKNILYLGIGVSGGEEGARYGPSLMPGGNIEAWHLVKDLFQRIAAKVDGDVCCQWVGEGGAGHYVKMVHNGIEYGDMQLICEAYQIMRFGLDLSVEELAEIFSTWNRGVLNSYLIEITADILTVKDGDDWLIDKVLDTAGQKGTGMWTGINALELGVPLTLISEAVFARTLSSMKGARIQAAEKLGSPVEKVTKNKAGYIQSIHDALYASKVISYAQGFMLMNQAAEEYQWKLNYGDIALMWRGGCIIRSRFLGNIKQAYEKDSELKNVLLDDFFIDAIKTAEQGWRNTVAGAAMSGVPVPAMSSALSFYDGYRSERLPANLLQAQRDYFGAHTYERTDKPRGEYFHTDWIANAKKEAEL